MPSFLIRYCVFGFLDIFWYESDPRVLTEHFQRILSGNNLHYILRRALFRPRVAPIISVPYAQQTVSCIEGEFRLLATLEMVQLGRGTRQRLENQRRRLRRMVYELPVLENPFVPPACGGMCGWSS
jgi:hypothetical protein